MGAKDQDTQDRIAAVEAKLDALSARLDRLLSSESERDTLPAPPVQTTWNRVAKGFNAYFEKRLKLAWYYGPHVQALTDIAAWCDGQARLEGKEPDAVLAQLLKAYFADDYAKQRQYPPKLLASQCARYYNPPAVKPEDEPDPEAINARRLRERHEAELRAKLQRQEENAAAPPPLEALLGRIGRPF